jgi:hypothetical protein
MAKKPVTALTSITKAKPTEGAADKAAPLRGSVQTVRMDRATLKVLKDASFDRGISQQDIMLGAIRRDLGLE